MNWKFTTFITLACWLAVSIMLVIYVFEYKRLKKENLNMQNQLESLKNPCYVISQELFGEGSMSYLVYDTCNCRILVPNRTMYLPETEDKQSNAQTP